MKKIQLILILFVSCAIRAQITTNPGTPTISDEIVITLDTSGTELENYTGDIYAHTGVTADDEQWQNVIGTWEIMKCNLNLPKQHPIPIL
ncbi:hypothetical protein [Tenacibaculum sp. SG-28]|uniref:hypothetical protein n=1 Tax=Tenacibaculum sp. SG-28 TaxID=754426 RepID=UPI000CF57E63|nr:hypothetical protein [Tenacibaculum sp. SG-28]